MAESGGGFGLFGPFQAVTIKIAFRQASLEPVIIPDQSRTFSGLMIFHKHIV